MTDQKPKSSPTMNEVAKKARVSVATVSRVVNGNGGVSAKLEKRVQNAMKEMHYYPSTLARSFKMQQTKLIGVIVPLLDHPFYSRLATSIEKALFINDYRALICNSEDQEKKEHAYIEMLLRQRVDGVIINPSSHNNDYLKALEEQNIPYVLIDRDLKSADCDKVFSDNSQGGYIGMKYLIELGHRRIGIVAAPTFQEPIIRRIRGIREALADHGIPDDPNLMITANTQLFNMGYESAKHLLQLPDPPTAIFALTDVTAVGVLHGAVELGYAIPDDLSVLGYDDIPIASYTLPPLTTIAQPIIEMGQTCVELLFKRIDDPESAPETAVHKTHLVIRQSTKSRISERIG